MIANPFICNNYSDLFQNRRSNNSNSQIALQNYLNMNSNETTAYIPLYKNQRFSALNLDEAKTARPTSSPKTCSRPIVYLLVGIITIILTLLLYQFIGIPTVIDQCGTTPAEARENGCVFEMTGFSWLPKECSDPSVEAEFISSIDLKYYRDQNYTQEVSLEEVKRGDGPGFFVKQDYHLAHCGFLFKKFHRATSQGRKVDGLVSPLHHTSHCVDMLLGPSKNRWDAIQFAFIKYPYCGKDGGYNVEWSRLGEWID